MSRVRQTILVLLLLVSASSVFGPVEVTVAQSAAVGTLPVDKNKAVTARLSADLGKLKASTPKIADVCKELAAEVNTAIANVADNKIATLANLVKKNVLRKIITSQNIEDPARQAWADAYDKLIVDLEDATDTFDIRKAKYEVGAAALISFANTLQDPPSAAAIPTGAFDLDATALRIAKVLNSPQFDLINSDTEFAKTVSLLVAELESLKAKTDPATANATTFKEETKEAVLEVINSLEQANEVQENWRLAYNMFVSEVEKSQNIDATTAKGWDQALNILIVGLKRAAGIKDKVVDAAKRAQGREPPARAVLVLVLVLARRGHLATAIPGMVSLPPGKYSESSIGRQLVELVFNEFEASSDCYVLSYATLTNDELALAWKGIRTWQKRRQRRPTPAGISSTSRQN